MGSAEELRRAAGNCLVTAGNGGWSPLHEDMDAESWHGLQRWLARGNALIIMTSRPAQLPTAVRGDLFGGEEWDKASGDLPGFSHAVDPAPTTVALETSLGGQLTVSADGPRWKQRTPPSKQPSADTVKTDRVQQLAGDDRGGVLFRFPRGAGALYLLLDDFAWTNAGLDHGENARVLGNILAREVKGGVLGIDEYRHGHGRAESFLTYLLGVPGASLAALVLLGWGILYLYGRNVRLRPVEDDPIFERRTAREYVDAVAGLHERAGQRRWPWTQSLDASCISPSVETRCR